MATASEAPLVERDYFTDLSVLLDPYEYFEAVRAKGPVYRDPNSGLIYVTGFAEAVDVLLDTENYSSFNTSLGPVTPLPFEPEGDDIRAQIAAARDPNSMTELMVNYDGQPHDNARALLNHLFTPSRLRANEEFMASFATELVREAVARGGCELINEIATPYVTLVIADLLGVSSEDQQLFRKIIDDGPPAGDMNSAGQPPAAHVLMMLGTHFARYVQERTVKPRDDVMSEMTHATLPDGSKPPALEVIKAAMFLFAAGQDTSAKLLGNSMRLIAEDKELQARLRADHALIPGFLEEVLRLEGSTKATFRLAQRSTRIGDLDVPAGSRVVIALSAANRDPRRWQDPKNFEIGRSKIKEHVAFGRGAHTCIGAPLARAEVRVIYEKFFEATSDISLDEDRHGPKDARRLSYEPSYIIRGLNDLHIKLAPA